MCVHQNWSAFPCLANNPPSLWLAVEFQAQWLKVSGLASLACRITAIALGFARSFVGRDACFGFFPLLDFRCCGLRQQALVFDRLQSVALSPTGLSGNRNGIAGGKPLLHLGISRLRRGGEFCQKLTLGLGRSSAAFRKAISVEISQ